MGKENLHQKLLDKGFHFKACYEKRASLINTAVKNYIEDVTIGRIKDFAIIPGEVIPEAKPKIMGEREFSESLVFYIRPKKP